jgi:hypothetical protein
MIEFDIIGLASCRIAVGSPKGILSRHHVKNVPSLISISYSQSDE